MDTIWTELTQTLPARIAGWLPRVAAALAILMIFVLIARLASRLIRRVLDATHLDETLSHFITNIVRYVIIIIGMISALAQVGVDTTSLLASLGVLGLTLGFAAQDTVSNIISGLFLFWDRPFVIGDLVEIDGHYGRVDSITLRSTRVVTPDGKMLAIPNRVVANTTVASYTNFPNLRLEIDVTVSVEENLGRVRDVMQSAVAEDPDLMSTEGHRPEVVVTALNDYNVALQLRVWLRNEKEHVAQRFRVRETIFEALRDAGVDMPYETLEVRTPALQAA